MIELRNLTKKKVSKKRVDNIAQAFFKKYKIKPEVEISLAIVSDAKMKEINSIYRGKDKTTDVLSFPELNEIIISLSQIERQAKESGRRLWQEFDFILVHGLLHLVGYTDEEEKDRLKMIKLGEDFLQDFKKAFTLIEMMIVLFIVGLLSSVIIANYNVGYSTTDLVNSQTTIQQNLKLAQSYALNSKPYNGVVPTYWAMSFLSSSQKIYLFADLNGNYLPDSGETDSVYGAKEISLPSGMTFRNSYAIATVTALFAPGSGEMVVYDSDSAALNYLEWHLELKDKHFNVGKLVIMKPGYVINSQDCSCADVTKYCCSFCGAGSSCNDIEWVCGETVVDPRDSKQYPTVKIGTQCWMGKDLAYLPSVQNNSDFISLGNSSQPAYGVFGYNGSDLNAAKALANYSTYGVLYNWYAAMAGSVTEGTQGICPPGWHLPKLSEFTTFQTYLGGYTVAGGKLKQAGYSLWLSPNMSAANNYNFTAIPAGYRTSSDGSFANIRYQNYFWSSSFSSSNAYYLYLDYYSAEFPSGLYSKLYGFSVRCLKD